MSKYSAPLSERASYIDLQSVKKVRRQYLNINLKLKNVKVFAKLRSCDIKSITKDMQRVNSSLISK